MTLTDPEQEHRRLAKYYAEQSDEELQNLANQAHDLTDIARQALEAELSKRGVNNGQLEPAAPEHNRAEFRNLVTIRSFWYLAEAELAKGLLGSAGIESFLFDENIVGLGWYANAVHGVKLRVDASNVEAANEILAESTLPGPLSDEDESTA